MRKQLWKLGLLWSAAIWPTLVCGQSPPAGKIGVLNIQAAIASTVEGKKAFGDLDKKYASRRQDLQDQQQAITALQDQLSKQNTALSEEEQRRLNRDLQEKQTKFKRAQEDAQADFSADSNEVVNRIGQKLVRLVDEYAQQNGYALILEGDPQRMPVYYVAPQIDLTEEMVKRYDTANPVAADTSTPNLSAPPPAAATRPPVPRAPIPKPTGKPKP